MKQLSITGSLTIVAKIEVTFGAPRSAAMQVGELIKSLSDPAAYDHALNRVEIRQTHISVVFLAGEFAFKLKKPVNLGFLDFTTLAKRQHDCMEEVRLNRRLAPGVYLDVVPIVGTDSGLKVGGAGQAIEWAVKMRRLPDQATLLQHVERGNISEAVVRNLAQRIARFHMAAERGPHITALGRYEVVADNCRENFRQSEPLIGVTISRPVFERLVELTESELTAQRTLIDHRAEDGVPCDTHGDLHLDHVYVVADQQPPNDLLVIDCIEFNERFRFADPVADMAFLVMDFGYRGRRDLSQLFADEYFRAGGDFAGSPLLALYATYRAAVRAKVAGFKLAEAEIPEAEKRKALTSARAHWLYALRLLEQPAIRPCLILVAGLPGTGKSTLARELAASANFVVVRSDEVRKNLAGLETVESAAAPFGEGIYSAEWNDRTYAECLRQTEAQLFEGRRVIVDANFGKNVYRKNFVDAAARWRVPMITFVCHAPTAMVERRLRERRQDASDADVGVYRQAVQAWEPFDSTMQPFVKAIPTDSADVAALALCELNKLGLY